MTTLYIRLPVVVDGADPMRCSEECPHLSSSWCECLAMRAVLLRYNGGHARAPACIAATNAAIDAEIEAVRRGFSLCEGASSIGDGLREMRSERERLEARKVKP